MSLLEDRARAHARRMRWLCFGIAAFVGAFAVLLAVARFHPQPSLGERVFQAGAVLALTFMIVHSGLERPRKAEVGLRLLAERPQDIVWIYILRTKSGAELVLAAVDGQRVGVAIPGRSAD